MNKLKERIQNAKRSDFKYYTKIKNGDTHHILHFEELIYEKVINNTTQIIHYVMEKVLLDENTDPEEILRDNIILIYKRYESLSKIYLINYIIRQTENAMESNDSFALTKSTVILILTLLFLFIVPAYLTTLTLTYYNLHILWAIPIMTWFMLLQKIIVQNIQIIDKGDYNGL